MEIVEPERWRRVEELYHSALRVAADQRARFLKDECHGDKNLCEEVQSLLAYETSAKDFMETPAFEMAAKQMAGEETNENQADPVPIGTTLQRFHVLEKLGVGGMGVVYKAEDNRLHRTVALKFLPKRLARDPASLERFEREAHAASALNHPNICTVYDIGEHEGQPFIAMELLEGQTLDRRIGGQPLPTPEWLALGIQITQGLQAAHQKGIIHRDIKPANIFVTSEGQAKILDFGLAKLAPAVTPIGVDSEGDQRNEDLPGSPHEIEQLATPDPSHSRTGVAMGTAGYMSPEQARGEKLDARTDLFSLGLVLFEMATGQRAFSGDTGPELHAAILSQTPTSARKLNPKVPAKLDQIIRKSLEKERGERYQSAAELRTDLEILKRDILPKTLTFRRWAAPAVVLTLGLVAGVFWYTKRLFPIVPDLKLRQLTFNPSENPLTGGAISPDGKYIAYSDAKGMHIKIFGTDETRSVPQPQALKNDNLKWDIGAWFPDSTRFLANAHPASENAEDLSSKTSSIWTVSVQGGTPREIRDNAIPYGISPDGNVIAYGANKGKLGNREIWLMQPDGERARKLFATDENSAIGDAMWSRGDQRMLFIHTDESGDTLLSGDLKGQVLATLLHPAELKDIPDLTWLPDGRFLYAKAEPGSVPDTCNYWTMRVDTRSGKTIENPRRLTNWAGFCVSSSSVTADGKSVTFLQWSNQGTGYMADLEATGKRIANLRHFTLEEGDDAITDWTADSKTVIVSQNRGDHYGIYKQLLDSDTPEPIVTNIAGGLLEGALVSPDGRWIIALVFPIPGGPSTPRPIVRIPISGGSPELILSVSAQGNIFCARPPSNVCAVVEASVDRKQMIVSVLDPIKGRGHELARFDVDPFPAEIGVPLCDISPDGTRLATSRGPEGPIQILSLRGKPAELIQVKGLHDMRLLGWAADGQSLIISKSTKGGGELLHVDLRGKATLLWKCSEGGDRCVWAASPDGRHLGLYGNKLRSNLWMMENF